VKEVYTARQLRNEVRLLMRGEVTPDQMQTWWAIDLIREVLDWGTKNKKVECNPASSDFCWLHTVYHCSIDREEVN